MGSRTTQDYSAHTQTNLKGIQKKANPFAQKKQRASAVRALLRNKQKVAGMRILDSPAANFMILPRQRRRPAEEGGPFFGTRRARATWKIEHLPEPNHEQHRFFIYKNHGFLLGQTRFWMGQTVGPTSGGAKDLVELDFGKTGVFSQTSSAWDVRTGSRVRIMIASL